MATDHDPQRVVIFIDGQNVYNDARRAYGPLLPASPFGQIKPIPYGYLLASRRPHGAASGRTLKEVRIYRGKPDPRREPTTYAAHMRQTQAWVDSGATVITRPLRYPEGWPSKKAEEKGIDVEIAIDMVTMAINGELDVAILASTDTDLRPALEAFFKLPLENPPIVEVATWRAPNGRAKQLRLNGGRHVWCHFLETADYERLKDTRDYNVGRQ
jgi:uncharacterized LabA/DUF88 family protein